MDSKDKIYVGSGKEMFEGSLVNTSINLSKINTLVLLYYF